MSVTLLQSNINLQPAGSSLGGLGAEIALGSVQGVQSVTQGSEALSIGTVPTDIWPEAAVWNPPALSGVGLEVVSDDANDAAGGSGARTVVLTLLDTSYVRSQVTVELNGTTPVAIPGSYVMCESMRVVSAGASFINEGIVRAQVSGGGSVQSHMPAFAGQSLQAFFGVAADEVLLLRRASAEAAQTVAARFWFEAVGTAAGVRSAYAQTGILDDLQLDLEFGVVFPSQSRVRFLVQFASGASNDIGCLIQAIRVKNDLFTAIAF